MLDKAKIKEMLGDLNYLKFWSDDPDYEHLHIPKMLTGLAKAELEDKEPKHIKLSVPMEQVAKFVTPDSQNNYLVHLAQMLEKNPEIGAYALMLSNGNVRCVKLSIWGSDSLVNSCTGALEIAKDTAVQESIECELLKNLVNIKQ